MYISISSVFYGFRLPVRQKNSLSVKTWVAILVAIHKKHCQITLFTHEIFPFDVHFRDHGNKSLCYGDSSHLLKYF